MNDSVESFLTFRLQTLCVLLVLTLSYGGFCVFVRMVWTAWQKLIQDYNIRDVVMFHCFLLSFSGIEIHLSASVNDLMVCVCVEEVKNMQSTSGESFSVQPLSYCKIINVMCEINQKMTTPAEWWVLVLQNVTWTRDSEVMKLRCWGICLVLTILLILCWVNETGVVFMKPHIHSPSSTIIARYTAAFRDLTFVFSVLAVCLSLKARSYSHTLKSLHLWACLHLVTL